MIIGSCGHEIIGTGYVVTQKEIIYDFLGEHEAEVTGVICSDCYDNLLQHDNESIVSVEILEYKSIDDTLD